MMLDSTLPRPLRLWGMTSEQQLVRLLRLESMRLGGAALHVPGVCTAYYEGVRANAFGDLQKLKPW